VIYTLDEDFTRQQFIDEFGQGTTFPQVILNEEKLGGCVDTVKYLRENNFV
jgi:glutaredoxin